MRRRSWVPVAAAAVLVAALGLVGCGSGASSSERPAGSSTSSAPSASTTATTPAPTESAAGRAADLAAAEADLQAAASDDAGAGAAIGQSDPDRWAGSEGSAP